MSPLPDPTDEEQDPREDAAEVTSGGTPQPGSDAWVDAESAASFPASDPPSDWAGADESPEQSSDQEMA
jgi:hypothetical protein